MSKSIKKWSCKLLLFSGRPDPEWEADEETAKKVLAYCTAADPYLHEFEIPSILGYNGVMFYNEEQKITAFKGKMEIKKGEETILKTDLGRQLEIMILKDAPEKYRAIAMNQLTTDFD